MNFEGLLQKIKLQIIFVASFKCKLCYLMEIVFSNYLAKSLICRPDPVPTKLSRRHTLELTLYFHNEYPSFEMSPSLSATSVDFLC